VGAAREALVLAVEAAVLCVARALRAGLRELLPSAFLCMKSEPDAGNGDGGRDEDAGRKGSSDGQGGGGEVPVQFLEGVALQSVYDFSLRGPVYLGVAMAAAGHFCSCAGMTQSTNSPRGKSCQTDCEGTASEPAVEAEAGADGNRGGSGASGSGTGYALPGFVVSVVGEVLCLKGSCNYVAEKQGVGSTGGHIDGGGAGEKGVGEGKKETEPEIEVQGRGLQQGTAGKPAVEADAGGEACAAAVDALQVKAVECVRMALQEGSGSAAAGVGAGGRGAGGDGRSAWSEQVRCWQARNFGGGRERGVCRILLCVNKIWS
jgi:hypothetical protein